MQSAVWKLEYAVSEGRIVAVGSNSQIEAYVGPATRRIDLAGRTVIPGMADNHFHSAGGGPGVDLSRVRTMEELLAAIQERVETSKPGEIITTNSDWHEAQIAEQRLPLRRDLDAIAPQNPQNPGHGPLLSQSLFHSCCRYLSYQARYRS